jgi:hypothetical protein
LGKEKERTKIGKRGKNIWDEGMSEGGHNEIQRITKYTERQNKF